jgi:hypothetical protein
VPKNAVTELTAHFGSAMKMAAAGDCSLGTVLRAEQNGFFTAAKVCVLLARAVHPTDLAAQALLIARLAGLPE